MSKYTTELRYICEVKSGIQIDQLPDTSPEDIVARSRDSIFDTGLVIGSQAYSDRIKDLILLHYYTREICEETFGLWKLRLNNRLREKVNYYTPMYNTLESQAYIGLHPFEDTDLQTERSEERTDDSNGSNTTEQSVDADRSLSGTVNKTTTHSGSDIRTDQYGKRVVDEGTEYKLHSDTPQGSVDGIDAVIEGLEGSGFLSDAQKNTQLNTQTNSGSDVATQQHGHVITENEATSVTESEDRTLNGSSQYEDHTAVEGNVTETIKGRRGYRTLSVLLSEYREAIMNLDEMIIADFEDLFMQIW